MNVGLTHRIDEADGKAAGFGRPDALRACFKTALPAQGIVDLGIGAVQAETEEIDRFRRHLLENIVKEVAVGVDGHRCVAQFPGTFDGQGQIGVQGRFAPQKDHVG